MAPERLQFSFAGRITVWDPIDRRLEIGTRHFWLAPGVSVAGLAAGVTVTVIGHQEDLTARRIGTQVALA